MSPKSILVLVPALLLFSLGLHAQQFHGAFGVGLGWGFNSDDGPLPEDAIRAPLRILLQTGVQYRFNQKLALGIEFSTSVFQRLNVFTTGLSNELEDGTQVIDPLRTYSSIIALKPYYTFEYKGFEPYIALAFGPNFHVNRTNFDDNGDFRRQTTQNFSVIPEVGLGIGDFSVALKSVFGGHIDAFDEVDGNGVRTILAENRFLMVYITGSYRFQISKRPKR